MLSNLTDQARSMIRATMVSIRSSTPPSIQDKNRAMATQIRTDLMDGSPVRRLIIHLHSSGCGWALKTGGCTMCGFFAATSVGTPISSADYQKQVSAELSRHDPKAFPIIGLYNAGNILNEIEMPFDALEQICIRIARNPSIKRISIESKLEYIDVDKLNRLSAILGDREIELGIGVETLNEKIRDLCINKPFSNTLLQEKVKLLNRIGIIPKAYLLLKPPFLTEKESIEDIISSYIQLKQMGVDRINCETMTIEEHTLVYKLWQKNYYRTPWLWSIISILTQIYGRLYFTPFQYIVKSVSTAHNCDRCSDAIKGKIFDYQDGNLTLEELGRENCSCQKEWLYEMAKKDERPIEARITDILSNFEIAKESVAECIFDGRSNLALDHQM